METTSVDIQGKNDGFIIDKTTFVLIKNDFVTICCDSTKLHDHKVSQNGVFGAFPKGMGCIHTYIVKMQINKFLEMMF